MQNDNMLDGAEYSGGLAPRHRITRNRAEFRPTRERVFWIISRRYRRASYPRLQDPAINSSQSRQVLFVAQQFMRAVRTYEPTIIRRNHWSCTALRLFPSSSIEQF